MYDVLVVLQYFLLFPSHLLYAYDESIHRQFRTPFLTAERGQDFDYVNIRELQ